MSRPSTDAAHDDACSRDDRSLPPYTVRVPVDARLKVLVVGVLLVVGGCSAFSSDDPPLPDTTVVALLADLRLAQSRAEVDASVPPHLNDSVFAAHGVSEQDYSAMMTYYAEHPDEYVDIYNAVLDRLNEDRSVLRGTPARSDSVYTSDPAHQP